MRRISLTEEEMDELALLHKINGSSVVRERSKMLLLSDNGLCVNAIAGLFQHTRHTVSRFFNLWEHRDGRPIIEVLGVAKGRGAKVKLAPVADLLPAMVEKHNRNLKPIIATLEKEHSVKVGKQTLQNFLKDAGI